MADLVSRRRKAFVPYITSGDPTLERTRELWRALDRAGADIIEIGIPFSDPLADGPTIQRASTRALATGTTLERVLAAAGAERSGISARLVIFTYYNPVLALGIERFASLAAEAGIDGVLVPDLIPEEAGRLREAIEPRSIDPIFLVAPTTGLDRLAYVGANSPALVYAVSLTGVTGARGAVASDLGAFAARCRSRITAPIVIGFGISTPEQAAGVAGYADGVVVGSALVKIVEELGDSPKTVGAVEAAATALAKAIHGAR
jgi:tryptophan synthase alpha chain